MNDLIEGTRVEGTMTLDATISMPRVSTRSTSVAAWA